MSGIIPCPGPKDDAGIRAECSQTTDVHQHTIRGIQRYPVTTRRYCSMGVIAFNRIEWQDQVARIVDISVIGIGVESSQPIEPGLVWFKERVGGYRSGVLVWSKQDGSRYRGGIKFVTLSREEEAYIQEQVELLLPHGPFPDPDRIIASMIESFKKEYHDFQ